MTLQKFENWRIILQDEVIFSSKEPDFIWVVLFLEMHSMGKTLQMGSILLVILKDLMVNKFLILEDMSKVSHF